MDAKSLLALRQQQTVQLRRDVRILVLKRAAVRGVSVADSWRELYECFADQTGIELRGTGCHLDIAQAIGVLADLYKVAYRLSNPERTDAERLR